METSRAIANLFRSTQGKILIITHLAPDGDAVGSALALYLCLRKAGHAVHVYCDDPAPRQYAFLPAAADIATDIPDGDWELAVSLDCAAMDRMGRAQAAFAQAKTTVCIDHHITNTGYADYNLIQTSAATAQILAAFFDQRGFAVDRDMANCLYAGIITDSGQFSFDNTTPVTLRTAALLMQHGADAAMLNTQIFRKRTFTRTMLTGRALVSLRLFFGGKVAAMRLTADDMQQCGAEQQDAENIVNYAVEIEGVSIGMLVRELASGNCKCSLRSSGDADVARIAQHFGGGGHRRAAGCTIDMGIDEAVEALCAIIEQEKDAL